MMSEKECDFCKINSEPERIIENTNFATSFLSNPRLVPGHALIIPNRHVESLADLSSFEQEGMEILFKIVSGRMLVSLATGIDYWHKYRPDVDEGDSHKVDHVHFHLLPSKPGDEIYDSAIRWQGNLKPLSKEERTTIMDALGQQ